MSYFIITSIAVGLLLLYVVVLVIERKRGKRFFSESRARFDARVSRVLYIIKHIDWGAFFGHLFKLSLEKVAHDIVHGTLLMVRTMERTLTKAIRALRERLAHRGASPLSPDEFQLTKLIRRFKKKVEPTTDSTEEK